MSQPLPSASIGDRLFAALQYLLPKRLLSRGVYYATRSEKPWLKRWLIGSFLRGFKIDMQEAVQSDPFSYRSFNAFFTRALRDGARPIDPNARAIVSPADGTVSQCGTIGTDLIIQAKGRSYSIAALIGGDPGVARKFHGGSFICIYLAPYNYHRMHFPIDCTIDRTLYVPGALFSVNAATARTINNLFARNERVVAFARTLAGSVALALIGALFVGSIETVWTGEVNPPPERKGRVRPINEGQGRKFARGDELGRFNMGSTIIMLFEPGRARFDETLGPGARVKVGERIGAWTHSSNG